MTVGEIANKANTTTTTARRPAAPSTKKLAAVVSTAVKALEKIAAYIEQNHKELAEKDAKIAELASGAAAYLRHLKAAHLVETMVEKGMIAGNEREIKIAEVKEKFEVIPDESTVTESFKIAEAIVPSMGDFEKKASKTAANATETIINFLTQ